MYIDTPPASENHRVNPTNPSHSPGTQNLTDSSDDHSQLEHEDESIESNFGEIGMFGDFCLMCGEMIDGEGLDGAAYCSEECEYHQQITSESDWCDLSLEGYQLPSYGCSTAVSSAKTSPLNSPNLQASDRLAILCSGPPPCELLLPLDLGERLLGAKAVAERYLENPRKAFQDEAEADKEKNYLSGPKAERENRKRSSFQASINSTITTNNPLGSAGSHLKSSPALAQLTDLDHHIGLSEISGSKNVASSQPISIPQAISLIDLNPLPSKTAAEDSIQTVSYSRRRVSEPVFGKSKPISVSPSHRQLYHSSFSLTSLSSLSPSSLTCADTSCSTYFV